MDIEEDARTEVGSPEMGAMEEDAYGARAV